MRDGVATLSHESFVGWSIRAFVGIMVLTLTGVASFRFAIILELISRFSLVAFADWNKFNFLAITCEEDIIVSWFYVKISSIFVLTIASSWGTISRDTFDGKGWVP